MKTKLSLEGQQFGLFTVLKQKGNDGRGATLWECVCICGRVVTVRGSSLKNGNSTKCKNCSSQTHGKSSTKLYKVWQGMKTRCSNPRAGNFSDYGGRGIDYDLKWESFSAFCADMQKGYVEGLTLEREDNSKGYNRGNCKWTSYAEQNTNKRSNVIIVYKGMKMTVKEIARRAHLTTGIIYHRIRRGWDIDRIVNTKAMSKFNHQGG